MGLSSWVFYPLNIFIMLVVVVGGMVAQIPIWNLYDNFKDFGKFSFKKNNPKP